MRKEEILSKTIIAMSIIAVIGILIIGHTGILQAQAPLKPQPDPWDLYFYYGNAVDLFYPSTNSILKPDPTPWISLNTLSINWILRPHPCPWISLDSLSINQILRPEPVPWISLNSLSINWILKPDPTPWISYYVTPDDLLFNPVFMNSIPGTNPELWDLYPANEVALF